jgi:hypothetical protein
MYYFNPLTPHGLEFSEMVVMTPSSVDVLASSFQYFYHNDVRSTFTNDLVNVNCTNDFKTCVNTNTSSICFGNTGETQVIHSLNALIYGLVTTALIGTLMYLILRKKSDPYSTTFLSIFYVLPVIGTTLILLGLLLMPIIPYLLGIAIIMGIFPYIYFPAVDLNKNLEKRREDLAPKRRDVY